MVIRKGTDEFKSRTFVFPKPDKTAVQHFLVNEGEYDGKMNSFIRAVLNPGFDLPFHVHDDCEEIYTVIFGHVVYTDAEKQKHTLGAGDVVVCRCGEGHAVANPFAEPAIMIELNMPVEPKK